MSLSWIAQLLLCIFEETLGGDGAGPPDQAKARGGRHNVLRGISQLPILPIVGGGFGCAASNLAVSDGPSDRGSCLFFHPGTSLETERADQQIDEHSGERIGLRVSGPRLGHLLVKLGLMGSSGSSDLPPEGISGIRFLHPGLLSEAASGLGVGEAEAKTSILVQGLKVISQALSMHASLNDIKLIIPGRLIPWDLPIADH